jgi:hypothetical protein
MLLTPFPFVDLGSTASTAASTLSEIRAALGVG